MQVQFSLVITTNSTDTISPIMTPYLSRAVYIEGIDCCVSALTSLGGLQASSQSVDLYKDETISLTRQLKDLQNLTSLYTDFTQSFLIPATDTNNQIFQNFFDENALLGSWNQNNGLPA